jgi:peptide/nickel transport system substrate-binding protein
MVSNSKIQFFRASWIADYPDAENYLSLFYSPNFSPKGPNYTHFRNDTYDRLYLEALSEKRNEKRIELYQQMNHVLVDNAVIVPLFYDKAVRFSPVNVKGFSGNPMNILKLKYVYK